MPSHGTATTSTSVPDSSTHGATSCSKFLPESPMIQTVSGPSSAVAPASDVHPLTVSPSAATVAAASAALA